MNKKEQAEIFAIRAHDGKYRKPDFQKPYVLHPIDVANKLKKYGFADDIMIAGYLHDIVEDTVFQLDDIKNIFGESVASLVKGATEQSKLEKKKDQKELPWEVRKQETIDRVRELDLSHKAVVAADKISNLEDISILSGKIGQPDFSTFKRGFEQQKWYYENIYQSLIYGCDKNLPMFEDLKKLIDLVFHTPFSKDALATLSYKKKELLKLKSIFDMKHPNLENFYFQNPPTETYDIIKNYLEKNGIHANVISNNQTIITTKYPQIIYYLDQQRLSVLVKLYCYSTEYHKYNIQPDLYDHSKIAVELVINTILEDLYKDTLNSVKRKIREKKEISLD